MVLTAFCNKTFQRWETEISTTEFVHFLLFYYAKVAASPVTWLEPEGNSLRIWSNKLPSAKSVCTVGPLWKTLMMISVEICDLKGLPNRLSGNTLFQIKNVASWVAAEVIQG